MSSSNLPKLWTDLTKLDTFLVNKVLEKSKFSKNFINISWSPNQIFFTEFSFGKIRPILDTENDFETQNFEIFEKVVHNFGKPDEVII